MDLRTLTLLAEMQPHARAHTERVLAHFPGLTLTSTLRSPQRNSAVGGVPGSYHLKGRAADFSGSRADLLAARDFAQRDRVGRGCTGPEEDFLETSGPQRVGGTSTGSHLHCAW